MIECVLYPVYYCIGGGLQMNHINVLSKRENPELHFLDKIYLTEDQSIYVSLNTWTIVFVDDDGQEHPYLKSRKPEWFYMLRELIEQNGRPVSPETIFETSVFGDKIKKYELMIDQKVTDIYKELLKQDFYKVAKNKGLIIKKQSLKGDFVSTYGFGYTLILPKQGDNLYEDYDIDQEPLRPILTNTVVPDVSGIIHRELFVKQIKDEIITGTKAIAISGFGGYGKTSVAQILYRDYADSSDKTFDHVGYVSYKGDLKNSIISSMPYLCVGIPSKEIWQRLSVRLKNNNRKKLLIIDNVDRDKSLNQDPLSESESELFLEISGWPNMTVVLTTRLESIPGFLTKRIDTLGNDSNPQPCIDLFNLYNSKFEDEIDVIQEIIKYCKYHTYAIELVAKSSKSRKSLKDFFIKFKDEGYDASSLNIKTKYKKIDNNTTASIQIKKLFNITTRNSAEEEILNNFAILPDMEQISDSEMESWFCHTENDVVRLVDEGWMQCYRGQYYIHPLVKEAILLGYDEKKLPESVAGNLLFCVEDDMFFFQDEDYNDTSRKIRILDSVMEHILIKKTIRIATLSLKLADMARKINNRAIALRQYEKSESAFRMIERGLNSDEKVMFWKAKYYRGYVLSYTSSKFTESERYLKEALELSEELIKENPTRKNTEHLATSLDHYGYVLSNSEKDKEAETCIRKGLEIRIQLERDYPGEYLQMVAWSADNLGFLLSFNAESRKEGEELLLMALKYRKQLAKGEASSEVAWTCSNLACLYLLGGYNFEEAEQLINMALFEYQDLEQTAPKTHYANMAYICNNYGMLLLRGFGKTKEAILQLKNSLGMYRKLENDYPDSYFQEAAMVCNNIANILQTYTDDISKEVEGYYQEAITIIDDKYKHSSKLKGDKNLAMMLADISYNYWVYMLRDTKYENNRRMYRRRSLSYWQKRDANDSNISYFIDNSVRDEIEGRINRKYALVYYVQGGARKKRIWSNEFNI